MDCFPPADETYDILLDDFERGAKTAEVRRVFAELKEALVPLIAEIAEDDDAVDDSFLLDGRFPLDGLMAVTEMRGDGVYSATWDATGRVSLAPARPAE